MDLLNFRLFRTPRVGTAGDLRPAEMEGPLHKAVLEALATEGVKRAKDRVDDWMKTAPDLASGRSADLGALGNDARRAFGLLEDTDDWLRAREDRPRDHEFVDYRSGNVATTGEGARPEALRSARPVLCDWLLALWISRHSVRLAVLLTRRLLILDLLDQDIFPDAQVVSADATWAALHRRDVVMHASTAAAVSPESIELVRGTKVDDLYVIRSEWSCYTAGEIASITNVLAGESFVQRVTEVREEEVIETEEQDVTQSTEKLEEQKVQSELSKELERAAALQVGIEGSVDVSGQYGVTKFGASASASTAISLSENNSQASRMAREMTSRAVAKVESRVRQERVRRLLTRTTSRTEHTIVNDTDEHERGVYRWVDRVDRYQVFQYPNRLLLEFQIPEPASYLRYRLREGAGQPGGGIEPPPEFNLAATDITRENYAEKAHDFRASNLPAPPDAAVCLTHVLKAKAEPAANEERKLAWAAPLIQETVDVALPAGYIATKARVSGSAYPMRQFWRVESRSFTDNKDQIEGFHRITAYVYAGKANHRAIQDGTANRHHTVQLPTTDPMLYIDNSKTMYADAVLAFKDADLAFTAPVHGKVTVGMHISGASSAQVGFEVECVPSEQAMTEWQLAVYDALLEAWRGWDQQFRTQQLSQGGPNLSGINGRSPSRNKELVQAELKRQVITWLLNDGDFNGVDAMVVPGDWNRYSINSARDSAPLIQFLEQAFEWGNLTFMLYDYFWARESQWQALADIEAADPEFARFLRCGSARVVLPARPGFEHAVHHWLLWQEPFLGEPLPLPGDPLYVAVATEIRDIKDSPAGGIAGDSWETRMGTTLLWLDDDPELPQNDARRLGAEPNAPEDPYCTD